jgi:NAD(P)-dependent dehydrogenase (short-subunit alcohol dehydrogenase family)
MANQDDVAEHQKAIQSRQDQKDASEQREVEHKEAVQTGPVKHPVPPLPQQHLSKPGIEAEMQLKPQFMAEHYKGSGKLQGQVAIITGGDSGIGRAVAVLFAREGADVAILYLNEYEDAAFTQRCVEAEGQRCVTIAGDVKDMEFCQEAVDKVVAQWGRLDILVNNAAFQEHAASLLDLTEERFDETMRTNVYGYFHMAKAVLPYLKHGASIINTGSVTGLQGNSKLLDYSTTKGAIHAFTMSLAANLLDKGIGSTRSRRGRCGRRLIRPTNPQIRSPVSAPRPTSVAPRSRKSCRRRMCSWPRRSARATLPASCCR